jgi:CelD/BcsL family acetyltransferase involved in cellulose biosynthesis
VVETHDAIEPLGAEWGDLAERAGAPPFLHPVWFETWWRAFGAGRLEVLTSRRDGRLAGVLPLRTRRGLISSPTNWHSDLYGPVAEDEEAKLELLGAVFARRPRRVDFSFLGGESGDLGLLERAAGGRRLVSRVMLRSPYVPVEGDWDSYWTSLSKNLRSTVRRCRNRLEERGAVTIEVSEGRDRLDEDLEVCFRLEATGWKGERGTAIASQPDTLAFYTEISRWAAEQGILRLAFLRVDGAPVAFNLSFEAGGRHYLLKLGHEAALDRLGPGTVLTAELVKRAFDLGLESYEFMGGPDRYKLRWTGGECRELLRAQVFARSPSGWIDRMVQTHGRALAKRALRRGG